VTKNVALTDLKFLFEIFLGMAYIVTQYKENACALALKIWLPAGMKRFIFGSGD
jgi:hypothetical protein